MKKKKKKTPNILLKAVWVGYSVTFNLKSPKLYKCESVLRENSIFDRILYQQMFHSVLIKGKVKSRGQGFY